MVVSSAKNATSDVRISGKSLMSYQVVEFPSLSKNQLSSVAVVPRNWIHLEEDQFFCLWPIGYSEKQVEGFVENKSFLNKDNCKEYIISILGQYKKFAALELQLTELEQRKKLSKIESYLDNEEIVVPPGLPMKSKDDLEGVNLKSQMKSEMAVYMLNICVL
ncbi:uncharacterized protein LOC136095222 [Hydra vulgaris]|uniref:uncharacterized protein LOC136095222 n=1 Tax=Hydra vulgaris TaxID=6087 RepID=UPI0032EA081D